MSVEHHGKYRALWTWLQHHPEQQVSLSFTDVERILGFGLPPSSRKYLAHWYGYEGSAVARAIRDAGWRAKDVDLNAQRVTFDRL
jgi:hypothetical protein